mmetsp:Transcript_42845/g.77090  ORF Transcript_42845/g.77090 Transcript_42845/m.77090 type:complete len:108 (+) Transcript_42845:559-882(+)
MPGPPTKAAGIRGAAAFAHGPLGPDTGIWPGTMTGIRPMAEIGMRGAEHCIEGTGMGPEFPAAICPGAENGTGAIGNGPGTGRDPGTGTGTEHGNGTEPGAELGTEP